VVYRTDARLPIRGGVDFVAALLAELRGMAAAIQTVADQILIGTADT
jgi:hypothetical protein